MWNYSIFYTYFTAHGMKYTEKVYPFTCVDQNGQYKSSLVRFVHNTHMLILSQIARAIAHTITSTSTMVKIFCQQQEIWIRRDVAQLVRWPGNKHAKDNASLWCDIKRNEDGLLSSSLCSLFIVCTRYMKHTSPFRFTMLPSALEINSCALFRIPIPMC